MSQSDFRPLPGSTRSRSYCSSDELSSLLWPHYAEVLVVVWHVALVHTDRLEMRDKRSRKGDGMPGAWQREKRDA